MRVGVVTPYEAANYGAFLQAYATKKYLESFGHCVVMIKWRSDKARRNSFFKKANTMKEFLRNLQRFSHQKKIYTVMTDALEMFEIVNASDLNNEQIDLYVMGSDEIWNINVPYFQNEIFYGGSLNSENILTYAPSAGNASVSDFEKHPKIIELMKNIEIVGVRDKNTAEIAKSITGKEPEIVCDPTLLLKIEDYEVGDAPKIDGEYLLIYSYSVPKVFRDYLKRYAQKNNLKLVAACMHQNWCDENICCKPLEFIALIKSARAVFTTTFHGTIFTLLNEQKCAIYAGSKKLADLISWTKMASSSVNTDMIYDEFEHVISAEPNYSECREAIEIRRKQSSSLYIEELEKFEQHM